MLGRSQMRGRPMINSILTNYEPDLGLSRSDHNTLIMFVFS